MREFFIGIAGAKFGILPNLVKRPDLFTPEGFSFVSAVDATGYIFPIIVVSSFLCGLAFVLNKYVALAAIVLVPITLNFALLHVFLGLEVNSIFSFEFARESLGFIPLAMVLYIMYNERSKYTALLKS